MEKQNELLMIVRWGIGNATGHGAPIPASHAQAAARLGNEEYGPGTHWTEVAEGRA